MGSMDELFLREIGEHPEDDAPRLIYADWLEEHGDAPRAELIRVQVRLAQLAPYDPAREELIQREQELLGLHGRRWYSALPRFVRHVEHEMRRGFVSDVQMTTGEFLRRASRLFTLAPIDSVRLTRGRAWMAGLAGCPALARLTTLQVPSCEWTTEDLNELLSSPYLTRLRSLELSDNWLGLEGARRLADWLGLGRLSYLGLASTGMRDDGVQALLESPHLGRLEGLDLSAVSLPRETGKLIARCARLAGLRRLWARKGTLNDARLADALARPALQSLEYLDLSGSFLRGPGLEALAQAPQFRSLRELRMGNSHRGPGGVRALVSAQLDRLTALELAEWQMTDEGVAVLAGSARFPELRRLGLFFNHITDEGAVHLAQAAELPRLTDVELASNAVGLAGAQALLESPHLPALCGLGLARNRALAADLPRLAALPSLRRLRRLSLNDIRADIDSLVELVRSPHLAKLTCLDLGNNRIDNRVAAAIAGSGALAGLTELHLYVGRIDGEGVRALARSPYLSQLRVLDLGHHQDLDRVAVDELISSPNFGRLVRLRVTVRSPSEAGRLRKHFGERVFRS
jgi:uncharacterized protein (TIGR02996 family)